MQNTPGRVFAYSILLGDAAIPRENCSGIPNTRGSQIPHDHILAMPMKYNRPHCGQARTLQVNYTNVICSWFRLQSSSISPSTCVRCQNSSSDCNSSMKLSVATLPAVILVIVFLLYLRSVSYSRLRSRTIQELCKGGKTRTNCIDIMVERLVIATGISSNHYQEAMAGMIGSVQRMMPKTKIIVYDLGLTVEQRDNVSRTCGVELRTFNFTKYPDHVSPGTLNNFAWKPLIAAELSKEYEVIMWGDSSVRLLEPLQKHVFPHFLDVELPFVGTLAYAVIVQMTHNKTLEYLNVSRESMKGLRTIQGGCWVVWFNDKTKRLLNSWVDCALHKECIAPEGSKKGPCNQRKLGLTRNDVNYCGCHRFDQSALDVILFRDFGKTIWKTALQDGNFHWKETFAIHRGSKKQEYPVAYCT